MTLTSPPCCRRPSRHQPARRRPSWSRPPTSCPSPRAPQIPNPKHKGSWNPKRIPNPAYKGTWKPKQIPNPKYEVDEKLYLIRKPLQYVAIDIWQVKSGSIFDNIIIGDDLAEVNAIVDATWKATKDAEKAALEAKDKKSEGETKEDDAAPAGDEKDDDNKEDF